MIFCFWATVKVRPRSDFAMQGRCGCSEGVFNREYILERTWGRGFISEQYSLKGSQLTIKTPGVVRQLHYGWPPSRYYEFRGMVII